MQRLNFNRDWTVKKIPEGAAASAPGSEGQKVTLPHDAMIWEGRSGANPSRSEGGYFANGNYEYVKNFYVDEAETEETFLLEFEGIQHSGHVYVNGVLAGSVEGGYRRLLLDITPYLRFGAENLVLVKAINTAMPNSRWYTGSGIYRPVYLYKGGKIRIDADGLRISTPEISEGIAAKDGRTENRNHCAKRKYCGKRELPHDAVRAGQNPADPADLCKRAGIVVGGQPLPLPMQSDPLGRGNGSGHGREFLRHPQAGTGPGQWAAAQRREDPAPGRMHPS